MPQIEYIIDGTECMLYSDDCFYTIIDGIYYKLGKLCKNKQDEVCCFVQFPCTTKNKHHGFIKVEKLWVRKQDYSKAD